MGTEFEGSGYAFREFRSREELEEFLKKLGLKGFKPKQGRQSNDPADYDRSVKIDNEMLEMKLWAFEKLEKEWETLYRRMDVLKAKMTASRKELFLELHEAYPEIAGDEEEGGVGWRIYNDVPYYVAWDRNEPEETDE